MLRLLAVLLLFPSALLAQDMRAVFAALQGERDPQAFQLARAIGPDAEALARWQWLRAERGAFSDYVDFAKAHPGWPSPTSFRRRAERAMDHEPVEAVRAFFADQAPLTLNGAMALAGATGSTDPVVSAWKTMSLSDHEFAEVQASYGAAVAPHHMARASAMAFAGKPAQIRPLFPLVSEEERKLLRARQAYLTGSGEAAAAARAVPRKWRDDPALHFAHFRYLLRQKKRTAAAQLMVARSASAGALGDPEAWLRARRDLTRWALGNGDARLAYRLATSHHTGPDAGYGHADAEWLAGYIALKHRKDPEAALAHFSRFLMAVETPISLARGWFWTGEAALASGDRVAATQAWERAAEQGAVYYGHLGASRLGLPLAPQIARPEPVADWKTSGVLKDPLVAALALAVPTGETAVSYLFADQIGASKDADTAAGAAQMLVDEGQYYLALTLAKAAQRRGIYLPHAYHALHPLAQEQLATSPALALAIARQESEFRPVARSRVGARGLMQVMPDTARAVTRGAQMPYSLPRLSSDWRYNAQVGSHYLKTLEGRFGVSPVLIAAGYNAGPGRPSRWMAERGDPRVEGVDPIDWVEMIPFDETRNYVMRVTEALPVYQARLGLSSQETFYGLLKGNPTRVRPRLRPVPQAPESSPRPQLRPAANQ